MNVLNETRKISFQKRTMLVYVIGLRVRVNILKTKVALQSEVYW